MMSRLSRSVSALARAASMPSPPSILTLCSETVATIGYWLLPSIVLMAIAARRIYQQGSYFSGIDTGVWLAFSRDFIGGDGRATECAYPPLIPVLIQLGEDAVGPNGT